MNILLINHYAGSPEMGMEFRPYYFAREWVKMGHKVDIIAADYSHLRRVNPNIKKDFQKEVIDGINYYWVKTSKYEGNGLKRSLTMATFIRKLWFKAKWIIRNLNPHVVICSSTYPLDTYVGQRIKRISKEDVTLVHEVHDMWPATLTEIGEMSKHHPFVIAMQIGENSAYKKSDHVISLLPNAEEYMMEHGLEKGKFKCIPNGIISEEWDNPEPIPKDHIETFKKLKEENKFIVGYFGGHALSNALNIMLDISEEINDDSIHFVLVGDGVEKKALMKEAETRNLKNITFLPPVRKKSIPSLCEKFDCVYIGGIDSPLYRFGLCLNKMFDSMASGKPIICALGRETYVTKYKCGYDVYTNNIQEICKKIIEIKNLDNEALEEIKIAGKKASREKFNYEKLSKEFVDTILGGENNEENFTE